MSTTDIEGLVVGGVDYGEADRVVYLLSRKGRIALFAHGAKTSKRRLSGALEPFTTIRASVSESKKRKSGMPTLSQALVDRARLALRRDLKTIALASYVVELSSKVAPEGEPSDGTFMLASEVLDHLCEGPTTMAVRRAFELRLIGEIGYRPELSYCIVCGERIERAFFDLNRGGISCEAHRENAREIGPKTLGWTREVLDAAAFTTEGADLDEEGRDLAAKKLTGPFSEFFARLLDRAPRSLALLEAERL